MRRHAVTAALVLLAIVVAIVISPGMHASGALTEIIPLEFGEAATPTGVAIRGPVRENIDGYRVAPQGEAVVTVALTLPDPREGHTLLRVWAYGPPGVRTTAVLRAADGSERTLGQATSWVGETFDVTAQARLGSVHLRVRAENGTNQPVLFLDRLAPVAAPGSLELTAPAWAVGLLVGLVAAALLALTGRLRRHGALAALLALSAAVLWQDIAAAAFEPLAAESAATWDAATQASWLGLHDGLLWGSWTNLSSLAVQAFHAFTPLVGTAPVSARAAAMLTALLALAALYAFGARAAGRAGAVVAVLLALVAVGFRDGVVAGAPLPALVLAGALFGYAMHACLADATPSAIVVLGAAAALLGLAEPAWLPGAAIAVVVVAFACAQPQRRLRVAGVGLVALVLCTLPHLTSTASQNDGRVFATMDARAVAARNAEFLGRGRGAPGPEELARDPQSGRPVGLAGYLFSDHSLSQFAGGVLAGGQASITAFDDTDSAGVAGLLAFVLAAAGALFVALLPRLRLLVALSALVVVPTVFIAAKAPVDPAAAGAALWPAMLVCASIMLYTVARLARPLLEPHLPRIEALQARVRSPRLPGGTPAAPDRNRT